MDRNVANCMNQLDSDCCISVTPLPSLHRSSSLGRELASRHPSVSLGPPDAVVDSFPKCPDVQDESVDISGATTGAVVFCQAWLGNVRELAIQC